tara:strand:- start:761 stop:964 length:204 start_codon:yes stop_codon:yes gene_type:complete
MVFKINNGIKNRAPLFSLIPLVFTSCGASNKVNNDWQDESCMADIKLRLGYRLSTVFSLPIETHGMR